MIKKSIFSLFVVISFILFMELIACAANLLFKSEIFKDYTLNIHKVHQSFTKSINPLYKNYFCDMIHHNNEGHKLLARCVANTLEVYLPKDDNIRGIALGGSTTLGYGCNSDINWVSEVERLLKFKIKNLGAPGKNSDNSLRVLNEALRKKYQPNFIIEGDWFNEFFEQGYSKSFLRIFLFRLNFTLYKRSTFFRFLSNSINASKKNQYTFNDMRNFQIHHLADVETVANANAFNFSEDETSTQFNAALRKYSNNMKHLHELSTKYGFQVYVLNFPYIQNYYQDFSASMNIFFQHKWIPLIKKTQRLESQKYKFHFIDAEKCFSEFLTK